MISQECFIKDYSAEIAAIRAPKIMYMSLCILTNRQYIPVTDYHKFINRRIINSDLQPLKYLRKVNPISYSYVIKADELYSMIDQ